MGLLLFCGIFLGTAPAQAVTGAVTANATVDGRPVGEDTLLLDPAKTAKISVTVHNGTSDALHVKTIRLAGTALALTFFAYDTALPFDVPAGQSVTRSFVLDLADLDGQATGLLPTELSLLDGERDAIAVIDTTGDVRGSAWSVYGIFGLSVLALTLLAWAGALFALARRRLPANRWQRATRFLPAGIGTGLVAVISLSVLRVIAPSPAAEIPFILGAAAVALALGYLTPHPDDPAPETEPEPGSTTRTTVSTTTTATTPATTPATATLRTTTANVDPEATVRLTRPMPPGGAA
ncbi:hypothetical protein F4559_002007 [Saccharothrix violaceirubra]|uniref:Uncharacterized protein n=1 Tax=Saccharothrix violaceirubra TaxID=413306 RepID=A0A7W7T155_9PSEU|nr:hypothetical protein [Saccharothrix violaceirubra]MBB4964648.1 hypothetical protein [Saccharothrix violaceirubra]